MRDFRGIIHCHSKYSHDSKGTYEEILAAAKAAKVDFICITDHPPKDDAGLSLREGWSGLRDGVLFIQGHELAGKNLLAIGIREPAGGDTPKERIAAIQAQGGVAIVSHPEEVTDWSLYEGADGMEIYNVHATFTRKSKDKAFPMQIIKALKEDPEHSFKLLQDLDSSVLKQWERMNLKKRYTGVAGNDSHQNMAFFGLQLDPYPRAFKFVTTHVLAEELTQEAILDGIRKGRAAVAFELHYPVGIHTEPRGVMPLTKPGPKQSGMARWGSGLARYDAWSYQLEGEAVRPWVLFNPEREQ